MGMIVIETRGSFPARRKMFPAMKSGHLVAAQDALDWFTQMVLIPARLQDKHLREDGSAPEDGWAEFDKRETQAEQEGI